MPRLTSILQSLSILFIGWLHVYLSPYTKVEESFNLHATHDVLMYGVGVEGLYNYDHHTFPGAVPRTFIGSLILAWLTRLFTSVLSITLTKLPLLILTRLILSTLSSFSLIFIKSSLPREMKTAYTILTVTQFHIPFWMGRTLPNTFAMIPVNIATGLILRSMRTSLETNSNPGEAKKKQTKGQALATRRTSQRNLKLALGLLTSTTTIFRAELALLLAPLSLQLLLSRRLSFLSILRVGLVSFLLSLALTVGIDTYFWSCSACPSAPTSFSFSSSQNATEPSTLFLLGLDPSGSKYIWPELSSITFNILQGRASEWGVSPWYTYFLVLPKLLLASLPLSLVALGNRTRKAREVRRFVMPYMGMVVLLSLLKHKEWRFLMYVIPAFNVVGAWGWVWLASLSSSSSSSGSTSKQPTKSKTASSVRHRLTRLIVLSLLTALVTVNITLTTLLTQASMANYPGGEALMRLHSLVGFSGSGGGGTEVISVGSRGQFRYVYRHGHSRLGEGRRQRRGKDGDAKDVKDVNVHISNLAAQTGASLFLHLNAAPHFSVEFPSPSPPSPSSDGSDGSDGSSHFHSDLRHQWTYNKTEHLSTSDLSSRSSRGGERPFTHLISEIAPWDDPILEREWKVMSMSSDSDSGFDGRAGEGMQEGGKEGMEGIIKSFDRWTIDWRIIHSLLESVKLNRLAGVVRSALGGDSGGKQEGVEGAKRVLWETMKEVWERMKMLRGVLKMEMKERLWILERRVPL